VECRLKGGIVEWKREGDREEEGMELEISTRSKDSAMIGAEVWRRRGRSRKNCHEGAQDGYYKAGRFWKGQY
jgi:hypothetical protein